MQWWGSTAMSEFRRNLLTAMNKAEPPITKDYLTIVALEDGLTAKLSLNACEYCVDGDGNWKTLPADTETETINAGQTFSFRGNLLPDSTNGIGTFTVSKLHNLKGNSMSMLFADNAKDCYSLNGKSGVFRNLFKGNDKLVNVSKSFLPATTLTNICYYGMFYGCTSLITVPQLPATTLAEYCYYYMFEGCSSLVETPQLPASELKQRCYANMFKSCSSLFNAPQLQATILASLCYENMFASCKNLVEAPKLPARTLVNKCYQGMFNGCSKLNKITMLATNLGEINCLSNWNNGVAESGTFVKFLNLSIETIGYGTSGIPKGWTVINYTE